MLRLRPIRVVGKIAREQLREHGAVAADEESGVGVRRPGQRGKRINIAGQCAVAHVGDQVQGRQQPVFRSPDGQLLVDQLDAALRQFGARRDGERVHVLYGRHRLHGRNLYAVRGDDVRRRDGRAGHAGAAERRLQDGLLLQGARLGYQQGLLGGGDFGLRAHHLDLRERTHFHLLAVIFQQMLRGAQRVPRHLHGFVEGHQVPVEFHDRGHGSLHLKLKGEVADLAIVLGDADLPRVDGRAETLQQVLRKGQAERRGGGRAEIAARIVAVDRRVVQARG